MWGVAPYSIISDAAHWLHVDLGCIPMRPQPPGPSSNAASVPSPPAEPFLSLVLVLMEVDFSLDLQVQE